MSLQRWIITMVVTVDTDHHDEYKREYPEFADETVPELLFREAVAGWEGEGLIDEAELLVEVHTKPVAMRATGLLTEPSAKPVKS